MMQVLREYQEFKVSEEDIQNLKKSGKLIMGGIIQRADALNQNGRVYPRAILERELRNYQKFIIENRALGELDHPDTCVLPGTEIFTLTGWKKIEDISEDETVATINVSTNKLEFQKIDKKIEADYDGNVYRFKNIKSFDFTVTRNHRILFWDRNNNPYFEVASNVYDNSLNKDSKQSHSSVKRASCVWEGNDPEFVEIAGKKVDATIWAAFLGIYLAEGHSEGVLSNNGGSRVCVTQVKQDTREKIRQLMQQLPWKTKETKKAFSITDKELHDELIKLGSSHTKFIPQYAKDWCPRLLQMMLDWMLLGDGKNRKGYKGVTVPEYATTSQKLADDVYEVMLKLGSGASIHVYNPTDRNAPDYKETGRKILAKNSQPIYVVYQHFSDCMSFDNRFTTAEVSYYVGKIYCVVTKNNTWLMRQNNKVCWTGNSVVELKNVSHIMREAVLKDDGTVYGKLEVLDTPAGKIVKSLVESGVKLGISSRGVGSTKKKGDYVEIDTDYALVCFDIVSEPSTPQAFIFAEGKIVEMKEIRKFFNRSDRIDRVVNDILNLK